VSWGIERVKTMMAAEPQGMVSKPHICWATDDLSHAIREVERLRAENAKLREALAKIIEKGAFSVDAAIARAALEEK
jgi:regulator of replication initiation timing